MDEPPIKISIVYPSHDREDVIHENLKSIQKLKNIQEIEIIIIDNDSSDSTKDIIKSFKGMNITLIEKNENLGFAKSINIGARIAKGEFIFISNEDVEYPQDFFQVLLTKYHNLKKDKEIILSPAVVFTGKYINYFGAKVHFLGFSYTPNMYQKISRDHLTFKTLKIAGCSVFMRRKTFLELRGFDPYFYMYHEDTDFSLNAVRNGISIYTTNETLLHHLKIQMAINNFTYYYIERNRYLCIYKHINKIRQLIPYIILTEPLLLFQALTYRMLKLRIKVYKFLIQNRKQIKSLRFNENNNKTIKLKKIHLDHHLDSILLGRIMSRVKILKLFLKILNLVL